MSISISSTSVLGQGYNGQTNALSQSSEDSEASLQVDKIRQQMQALENELLQMQSSSSTATDTTTNVSDDTEEQLEEQLEQLKQELKTAEAKAASSATANSNVSSAVSFKPQFDKYEKVTEKPQSSGIYTVKLNGEKGYNISYEPFSGSQSESASISESGLSEQMTEFETNDTDSETESLEKEKENLKRQIDNATANGESEEKITQLKQQLLSVEAEISNAGIDD